MKKNKSIIIVIVLLVIFLSLGGIIYVFSKKSSNQGKSEKIKIATSIFPIYDITQNIAGDKIEVVQILPGGASPHTFEPTIQAKESISGSDILFVIGLGLDDWAKELVEDEGGNIKIVGLYEGIDLIESSHLHDHESEEHTDDNKEKCEEYGGVWDEKHEECGNISPEDCETIGGTFNNCASACRDNPPGSYCIQMCIEVCEMSNAEDHEETEKEKSYDPHYWVSAKNANIIANNVFEELIELDPKNRSYYKINYMELVMKIDEAFTSASSHISGINNKQIVTFHNSFSYFAKDLGLEVVTTIEPFPGKEPTPAYLAEVGEIIKKYNIKIIYKEPQLSDSIVEALAKDYGVQVKTLDPLGGIDERNSYIRTFDYNLDTIIK